MIKQLLGPVIGFILGAFFVALIVYSRNKPVPPLPVNRHTDTLIQQEWHHDTITQFKEKEAPVKVDVFRERLWVERYNTAKTLNDSLLVVIGKKGNDTVNIKYVTEFIKEPKVMYGRFTGDSIRLDKLLIDGTIYTEHYGTDYQHFGYEYFPNSGSLSRFVSPGINLRRPPKGLGSFTTQAFTYGAYEFTDKHPILGATILAGFGRVGLRGNGQIDFRSTLGSAYSVGVYYKVW